MDSVGKPETVRRKPLLRLSRHRREEEDRETGETDYYYYYEYYDADDSSPSPSTAPTPAPIPAPTLAPIPMIVKEDNAENEYYYYYDDGDKTEPTKAPLLSTKSQPKEKKGPTDEEEKYYYYYEYDNEISEFPTKTTSTQENEEIHSGKADSSSPSSAPLEEVEYYYYFYDETDSDSPSSAPSEDNEEYYYYYYNEADSNSPSIAPSEGAEEYYYVYYEDETATDSPSSVPSDTAAEISSQSPSEQVEDKTNNTIPTNETEYYYYYYEENEEASESPSPSMSPTLSKSVGSLECGCEDFLLSSSMKHDVYSDHLYFTFTLETTQDFKNLNIIAENIIESASSSLLICDSKQNKMPKRKKGIFVAHFPVEDPIFKVASCIPAVDDANNCLILKGKLFIASNKPIDNKEKEGAYAVLTDSINTLHSVETLKDHISVSKFLGPTFQMQQNNIGDQVIFTILILSTVLGIVYAALKLKNTDWTKYRRL